MVRIAIVGAGIAGLGCAHFLRERFDLTLFEQADYIGGHTNTVTVDEQGAAVPIDTGFMVFNHATYPNLVRLFRELDVATKKTGMSFSVQHRPSGLEYNGGSLNLLFAQRRNLFRPRHWRMLMNIDRFNKEAIAALDDPRFAEMPLGAYVRERGYGRDMFDLYLMPMASAVWSTPPDRIEDFPAATLLRFWHNHGFLGLDTQHPWRTVCGGAKSYVEKLTAPMRERIRLNTPVRQVRRIGTGVSLRLENGADETFEKVILACHGDQALRLLADPTSEETRLLSPFRCQPNTATLHTDPSVMPRTRRCWASWNYRIDRAPGGAVLPETHYWMNRLQQVSERENYFVSLNCHERIAPGKVLRTIEYEHPLFDLETIRAQRELPSLNTGQTTFFAGAWFKYGFHEDGFTSALECARAITGEPIWS